MDENELINAFWFWVTYPRSRYMGKWWVIRQRALFYARLLAKTGNPYYEDYCRKSQPFGYLAKENRDRV